MRHQHFLAQLDHGQIVDAIRQAEKKTSGELRVFVSHKMVEDPVRAAQRHFLHMGMEKTRDRNGVLLFVAPRSRKFAVIGDVGVHQRCGDDFWSRLSEEMSGDFRRSEFTHGMVHAIRKAGDLLAEHFPRRPDDRNELSDEIGQD